MLLSLVFFYSLGFAFFFPILFPTWHLGFFVPFLVFAYYRKSKIDCLWLSLICGLILDLFSAQMRFGLYALNYTLSTYILYRLKNIFFEDKWTTLPLMTLFFSYLTALLQASLIYSLNTESIFSVDWIKTELIKQPLYNAIYAAFAFNLFPYFFPHQLKKTPDLIKIKGRL